MKRILAAILALSMAALWLVVPVQAVPTSGTAGENITWSFDETTKQITVTGSGAMDLGDYPIWSDLRSKVNSVVIEEGITSIDYRAFANFTVLHTVELPTSVNSIEGYAFDGCRQLTNISLEHITQLGNFAFRQCSSLEELVIPSGITTIPHSAFFSCTRLKKVVLHQNVASIEDYAFKDCSQLTQITIPNSVTKIGSSAFSGCAGLKTINLGSGITELSNSVFNSCYALESIRIPDNVTTISTHAFDSCTALKEVYLGAGVSEIAPEAFWDCTKLKAFTVSEKSPYFSVDQGILYTKDFKELVRFPYGFTGAYTVLPTTTLIQTYAAYETGITALTVPASVKTIAQSAFAWCEDLVTVQLSEGLTELKGSAFAYTGIQKIEIPASVTTIGQKAFTGCANMKQMIIYGDPPTIKDAFPYVDFTVFYPKKTTQWLQAHQLYGGLPSWELQCSSHNYVNGACSRCGVSDPKSVNLTGQVTVAGNNYAKTQVQIFAAGQTTAQFDDTIPVGQYLVTELLPGNYTLRASTEGCAPREYTFQATSGTLTQDLTLYSFGDLNGDGKVTVGEISRIYSHVRTNSTLSGYPLACADVNQNSTVNMGDIATLYAKLRNTRPDTP